jgi:hypothetical protein
MKRTEATAIVGLLAQSSIEVAAARRHDVGPGARFAAIADRAICRDETL